MFEGGEKVEKKSFLAILKRLGAHTGTCGC